MASRLDPAELTELLDQAVLANSAGRPARARNLLRRVLRSIGTGPVSDEVAVLRGRAKVTLALALFDGGAQREALVLLDEAERGATGASAPVVRTLALIQRSGMHGRMGRWADALAAMERIGDAAAQVSPRAAAVVALNSGLARQFLGDFARSAADLTRARILAVEHGQPDLAAAAIHNLGRLAFCRGDVTAALSLMTLAREASDSVRRSQTDLDQARVLLDAGLLDAAEELLQTAEVEARAAGLPHDVGEIALERARRALLLGEYEPARERARVAIRAFSRRGEDAWRSQAELLELEAELSGLRVTTRLVERTAAFADGAGGIGGIGAEAGLLAAEAAARSGDAGAARRRLDDLGGLARQRTLPNRLHRSLVEALVAVAAQDTTAANRALRGAVTQLAREQGRYAGLDARTAVALHGRRLQELDVTIALPAGPARVFVATERWRGVSHRLPRVSPTTDEPLNDLVARLRQLRLELAEAAAADRVDLLRRIDTVERAVQRRDWQTALAQRSTDRRIATGTTTHRAVRDLLARRGSGLISLFAHAGRLCAVTVGADPTRVTELGDVAELAELAQRVGADLAALSRVSEPRIRPVVERALQRSLARVSERLASALPAEGRVVVLPYRSLATLPWRLLPALSGRPVTVAPSATFWLRGTGAQSRADSSVTCVAGPQLLRAESEAEQIAALRPGTVALTGRSATGAAMTAALRDSRVVHVAAHGSHHEQSPLFSSILLADGPLFAHEFQRVGVGAEHVVLSACDVGRARVRQGEEALGLSSALLACGVRSVVAAVAPVRDEVAATVMTAYHRELLGGADAALALERASSDLPEARLFCTYGADWSLQ